MMLPILISVSLAPVSYFFCAFAAVAVHAAAANTARATKLLVQAGIVLSPWQFILRKSRKSGGRLQASVYSVRRNGHCCAAPIMIGSGDTPPFSRQTF